ncbi:Uu.00g143210.m01.CDS01 [Anthostomella pinea]|uniref:Uu.00g143210.m01.CDS01 n=1 Tax=Anthostomella pinea TaxID=933095 RepID=A0AAI8VK49_9PEZI|nr:Uu.00g143210.m01.CDS01 [Anthostomella pinea]
MHFSTAATVAFLAAAANGLAISQRATEHKVYVDTSDCSDNAHTLPQVLGISNSTGEDYLTPERFDGPTYTFTVPAYYQGELYLHDSAQPNRTADDLQTIDFYFYNPPSEGELNQVTISSAWDKHVTDVITAVRFASSPETDYLNGENQGSLQSDDPNDAIYVYYCKTWPLRN